MDDDAGATLIVIDAEAPDPVDEGIDLGRPLTPRYVDTEMDQCVTAGRPLAVPRPPPADRDLDLDHRLEPIDVGTLE